MARRKKAASKSPASITVVPRTRAEVSKSAVMARNEKQVNSKNETLRKVSRGSKMIRKKKPAGQDISLSLQAQVARMEARLVTVEKELKTEKMKNKTKSLKKSHKTESNSVNHSAKKLRAGRSAAAATENVAIVGKKNVGPVETSRSRWGLRSAAARVTAAVSGLTGHSRRQSVPPPAVRPRDSDGDLVDNHHRGSDRDLVDDRHRCSLRCLVSCQGHLRPNEIIIYEGSQFFLQFLTTHRLQQPPAPPSPPPPHPVLLSSTVREVKAGPIAAFVPARVRLLLAQSPITRLEAEEHSWNSSDCSFNLSLKAGDPFTVRRRPVAQSTDCVRGKQGYSQGLHVFSVSWPVTERGTHAVVGVATRSAPLHSVGYRSLMGSGPDSWGWDLGRGRAYHGRDEEGLPYPEGVDDSWTVPDSFHLILDMDAGTLSFEVEGSYLGPAFTGLKSLGEPLYPVISTVWGNCQVSLVYIGGLESSPLSLQQLIRETVRTSLAGRGVTGLGLPSRLVKFLQYEA